MEVKLRIKTHAGGSGRLQWRTEDQELFPETGQVNSFKADGGWQELSVPLAVEGRLVQVRLFLPAQKQPLEIDWIEVIPAEGDKKKQRWDF